MPQRKCLPVAKLRDGKRVSTFRKFLLRLTKAELDGLTKASMTDLDVKKWYDAAMAGPHFCLDHSQTKLGMKLVVQRKILTAKRAAALGVDF